MLCPFPSPYLTHVTELRHTFVSSCCNSAEANLVVSLSPHFLALPSVMTLASTTKGVRKRLKRYSNTVTSSHLARCQHFEFPPTGATLAEYHRPRVLKKYAANTPTDGSILHDNRRSDDVYVAVAEFLTLCYIYSAS